MEKCYDGALVMPKNSIVMTKDEMMQVEGGASKVGKFIWEFVKVVLYDIGVDLTKKQGKKLWKKAKKWLEKGDERSRKAWEKACKQYDLDKKESEAFLNAMYN